MSLKSSQQTIASILKLQSKQIPDNIAIEYDNFKISYADLWSRITLISSKVQNFSNLSSQKQRVGVIHENGPGMAILLLAISNVAAALPFNPTYSVNELKSYFSITHLDGLVLPKSGFYEVEALANEMNIPVLRIAWNNPLERISTNELKHLKISSPEDTAIVMLTSGSTGQSKVVPLTHKNICTSAYQVCKSLNLKTEDKCLCMWEQYHIGGLVDLLLSPLLSGGTVIITSGFSVDDFFKLLENKKPTWFQGVPTSLNALKLHAKKENLTLTKSSLRLLRSVAAPLSKELQNELEELFNIPVIQTFGMTEAGPLITSTLLPPYKRKIGSVGKPCGTEVAIFSFESEVLPEGKEGEVAIKGENVFSGYENDSNPSTFKDGWFFTGDLGYLDKDGDLFLTGRIKQLINRGGEKINPQEVDNQLLQHPDIVEAACFGVHHPTLGEDIMAAIVFHQGKSLDTEIIRAYLSEKLATFKIPSKIIVIDKIPLNNVGKVDRIQCSKLALQHSNKSDSLALPQTDIEKVLADIWMKELDIETININDNFFEIGGDSLSSAKIILLVEEYFNIKIPDKDILLLTSISQTAKYIQNKTNINLANFNQKKLSNLTTHQQLVLIELELRNKSLKEILDKLINLKSQSEFKLLSDSFTSYKTPYELYNFLQMCSNKYNLQKSNNHNIHFKNWINKIKLDLEIYFPLRDWKRSYLNDHIFLYQSSRGIKSKKLIIGFGGNAMKLMVPTYTILGAIDESDYDLMIIRDPSSRHYESGIPGIAQNVDTLINEIKNLATKFGYDQFVILGTSSGGLIALRAGQLMKSPALAIGPDNPLRHSEFIKQLRYSEIDSPNLRICISNENKRDYEAASSLKNIMPHINVISFKGIQSHNLILEIHKMKKLNQFFHKYLFDLNK